MVASYLLDAGGRSHNLDDLAQRYLNHTTIKIDQLIGKGKDQKRMDEVPVAQVATYAAEDADIPLRMHPILAAKLAEMELQQLNETVEVPLIDVLADMEFTGVRVDPTRLAELSAPLRRTADGVGARNRSAGRPSAQYRLAKAARSGAVPGAGSAGGQENEDGAQHRCRRAGATGRIARATGQNRRIPAVREAQEHVRRRADPR